MKSIALMFDINQFVLAARAALFKRRLDIANRNVSIEAFVNDEFALVFDSRARAVINGRW